MTMPIFTALLNVILFVVSLFAASANQKKLQLDEANLLSDLTALAGNAATQLATFMR